MSRWQFSLRHVTLVPLSRVRAENMYTSWLLMGREESSLASDWLAVSTETWSITNRWGKTLSMSRYSFNIFRLKERTHLLVFILLKFLLLKILSLFRPMFFSDDYSEDKCQTHLPQPVLYFGIRTLRLRFELPWGQIYRLLASVSCSPVSWDFDGHWGEL